MNDSPDERRAHSLGCLIAQINPATMVTRACRRYDFAGLDVQLLDTRDGARLSGRSTPPTGLHFARSLDVGGDTWSLEIGANRDFGVAGHGWLPRALLCGGLVMTLLASTYLVSMLRRTAAIEAEVRQRT